MRNRASLNAFFNRDRKTLYMILSIVMVSVLTLTVVYAALSTTLNINGNAEVSAASWDIYLDNVQLNSQSATTNVPTITDKTTATFSTTLNKPGDFYEFTVDVVNNGSIDAMIDSVTKTTTLTESQAKYLNYIVEYQNGEAINTKQLVAKNSYVRLKVKVEFRKDITASELPQISEILNLSFTVNYVQSDESGISVKDDGIYEPYKIGNEICYDNECFYIISSDEESVTMLAKYNLYVGGKYENESWIAYGSEATGLQDSTMIGWDSTGEPYNGIIAFSTSQYWESYNYVYNSNSMIYNYVENYKLYLESKGVLIKDARIIKKQELTKLGCGIFSRSCLEAPSWVYSTSYWTGSVGGTTNLWSVSSNGSFYYFDEFSSYYACGVRPVIVVEPWI